MQVLTIDPEFKNLIPPLSDDERAGLEASIKAEGCRESIIVWDGTIVDGHNRYEICTRLGIEFQTHEKSFPDADAVVEWIIKNQFGRRNLSLMDRSRLALRLEGVYRERAKVNQVIRKGDQAGATHQISDNLAPVNTLKEIARVAGVSHDTIHKVKTIEAKATPDQKADLTAGKATINKVYKEIKGKEPTKEGNISKPQPFSNAMQFARIAISQLTRIREEDPQRVAALLEVQGYINNQLQQGA